MPARMLTVGVVTATHGVAGDVKVRSFSGEPGHILSLREAVFRRGKSERRYALAGVRPQPPAAIVHVEGFDSPEKARLLVGSELWVPREQAAPLSAGEYYEADLCGCRVILGGREVGTVRAVLEGGAGALLEVAGEGGRSFLVPFTGHFVGDVDVDGGRIELVDAGVVPG